MEKQLPEVIDMDKSLYELCQNSIDLIEYAWGNTGKQINIIQLMTFYSLGRWIVEEQQQGEIWSASDQKPFRSSD